MGNSQGKDTHIEDDCPNVRKRHIIRDKNKDDDLKTSRVCARLAIVPMLVTSAWRRNVVTISPDDIRCSGGYVAFGLLFFFDSRGSRMFELLDQSQSEQQYISRRKGDLHLTDSLVFKWILARPQSRTPIKSTPCLSYHLALSFA